MKDIDNAQAMALVKEHSLSIYRMYEDGGYWIVDGAIGVEAQNIDLNRAIRECVAKMRQAK